MSAIARPRAPDAGPHHTARLHAVQEPQDEPRVRQGQEAHRRGQHLQVPKFTVKVTEYCVVEAGRPAGFSGDAPRGPHHGCSLAAGCRPRQAVHEARGWPVHSELHSIRIPDARPPAASSRRIARASSPINDDAPLPVARNSNRRVAGCQPRTVIICGRTGAFTAGLSCGAFSGNREAGGIEWAARPEPTAPGCGVTSLASSHRANGSYPASSRQSVVSDLVSRALATNAKTRVASAGE